MSPLLNGEKLRRLSEQAKRLTSHHNLSTWYRWRTHGVRGVKLECVNIGGVAYCSDESLDRFLAALNEPKSKAPSPVKTPRSARQKSASKKKADEILAARGI